MKISLNILERIVVLGILPSENDIITMKIIRKLKEDVGFTEDEIIKWNIKLNEGNITWNAGENSVEREYDFGIKSIEIISNALKELDKKKKITERHLSLYDKFVEEE